MDFYSLPYYSRYNSASIKTRTWNEFSLKVFCDKCHKIYSADGAVLKIEIYVTIECAVHINNLKTWNDSGVSENVFACKVEQSRITININIVHFVLYRLIIIFFRGLNSCLTIPKLVKVRDLEDEQIHGYVQVHFIMLVL